MCVCVCVCVLVYLKKKNANLLFMIKQLQQTNKPATSGVSVRLTQAFGVLPSDLGFKPPQYRVCEFSHSPLALLTLDIYKIKNRHITQLQLILTINQLKTPAHILAMPHMRN